MRLNNLHTLHSNHRSRRSNHSMHRNSKHSLLSSRKHQQGKKISDRLRYTESRRGLRDWKGRARRIPFFGSMFTWVTHTAISEMFI